MYKYLIIITFFLISCSSIKNQDLNEYTKYISKKDAIAIAEKIWVTNYGKSILRYKPYVATINSDSAVWHVEGTMKINLEYVVDERGDTTNIKVPIGGVPHALVDRKSGKVLNFYHEK